MPTIEISDLRPDEVLSFDLIDILRLIEPFGVGLDWYFIEFELGSFLGARENKVSERTLSLWRNIKKSQDGTRVSWNDLTDFALNLIQTDMALLVGVAPGSARPTEPLDLSSEDFNIVIQAVDCAFWAVTARNEEVITRIKNHFHSTEIVEKAKRHF
jgi:hypothetical protein